MHPSKLHAINAPAAALDPAGLRRCATFLGVVLLFLMLLPVPASAHTGTGLAGGFESGFLHPLTGPDHMLAMVSVGLWGAFLGRPLIIALPVLFPNMMAIGAAIGMAAVPLPPVEVGIAASVFTLGLMIAFAVRPPVLVACAVVAMFGLFHGYSHGVELPSAADPIGYATGFVLCTGLLHVTGIALGAFRSLRHGVVALRASGGLIAACGIVFLIKAPGL
ncbi:MAG: HupE/UreJ family protein [Sphingomicrobium sp.]